MTLSQAFVLLGRMPGSGRTRRFRSRDCTGRARRRGRGAWCFLRGVLDVFRGRPRTAESALREVRSAARNLRLRAAARRGDLAGDGRGARRRHRGCGGGAGRRADNQSQPSAAVRRRLGPSAGLDSGRGRPAVRSRAGDRRGGGCGRRGGTLDLRDAGPARQGALRRGGERGGRRRSPRRAGRDRRRPPGTLLCRPCSRPRRS